LGLAVNQLLRVVESRSLSDRIKQLSLARIDRKPLPAFRAGAHIVLTIADAATGLRAVRAYSLISSAEQLDRYEIAVQREEAGGGGSKFLHDSVRVGRALSVSAPVEAFGVAPQAQSHLLLGAGIGVTPLLSMAEELVKSGMPARFVYVGRSAAEMPFIERLRECFGERLQVVFTRTGGHSRPDLHALIGAAEPGRHLYVCGPTGFIDSTLRAARDTGWDLSRLHVERFSGSSSLDDAPFTVRLARSDREFVVPPGQSILDVLGDAGIPVPYDCRHGVCGACTATVLEGCPLHKDGQQAEPSQSDNREMRICVSRSLTPRLVLDL